MLLLRSRSLVCVKTIWMRLLAVASLCDLISYQFYWAISILFVVDTRHCQQCGCNFGFGKGLGGGAEANPSHPSCHHVPWIVTRAASWRHVDAGICVLCNLSCFVRLVIFVMLCFVFCFSFWSDDFLLFLAVCFWSPCSKCSGHAKPQVLRKVGHKIKCVFGRW